MEGGCTCRQIRYRLTGTPLIVHAATVAGANARPGQPTRRVTAQCLLADALEAELKPLVGGPISRSWWAARQLRAAAQKLPTIAFLGADASVSPWTAAFVAHLRELGWIEGRTIAIEYRWSEGRTTPILN
jgi:hypothetical protein